MKTKYMLSGRTGFPKIAHLMMLALAAGALLSAVSVKADQAVPFKVHGHYTITGNLQDEFVASNGDLILPALVQETGEGTHLGRYSLTMHNQVDFTAGLVSGEGSYTAANGNTLNFTVVQPLQPPNSPAVLTFHGGTGRFAHATGSETAYSSNTTTVQQGSLLIISADITTVGTISY